jgi:hypothetical protein
MKIRSGMGFLLMLLVAVSAAQAQSAETKKVTAPPAISEQDKAAMEALMKAATPGAPHKKLEPFVGTWDTKVKIWMKPDGPPMESTGASENRWILGNRFIEMRYEGKFMEQPFSGVGYTGYDNIKKKYIGSWMESTRTSIMTSAGDADATGQVLTFHATMDDPTTGKSMTVMEKFTITDNDHHTMEMWGPAPDGKMYKMMEITYTRKKV